MEANQPEKNEPEKAETVEAAAVEVEAEPVDDIPGESITCAQCSIEVPVGQEVRTQNASFCQSCFAQMKLILEDSIAEQGKSINFGGAVVGGLIGGLVGALIWWGFTVVTNIQFGLVAVVIGWGVGKGVTTMSGQKRALSLQIISVGLAAVSYVMSSYWVSWTFYNRYAAQEGFEGSLPFIPDPALLMDVVSAGFEMFDLIFVAIVLWQAWKMPMPIKLQAGD